MPIPMPTSQSSQHGAVIFGPSDDRVHVDKKPKPPLFIMLSRPRCFPPRSRRLLKRPVSTISLSLFKEDESVQEGKSLRGSKRRRLLDKATEWPVGFRARNWGRGDKLTANIC